MKKRVLTMMLLGSSPAAKADVKAGVTKPKHAPHAIAATAPRDETKLHSTVDPAVVKRVFAARLSTDSKLVAASIVERHPVWFDVPHHDKPSKRRIQVAPASFQAGGKGIKIKIPF